MRVLGVDLSHGMLRAGTAAGGAAIGDLRALPVRGRAVAGVWCQAAMLHVPRGDVATVLAEFARVTQPGGALHLGVAEGDGETWEEVAYSPERARWFVRHREATLVDRLGEAGWRSGASAARHRTANGCTCSPSESTGREHWFRTGVSSVRRRSGRAQRRQPSSDRRRCRLWRVPRPDVARLRGEWHPANAIRAAAALQRLAVSGR